MQNEKCIMHNCGVPSARFKIISEGNTFILHFAFYILHLPEGQISAHLSSPIGSLFSQQSIVHEEVFCYNKEKKIKMDVYML